MMLPSAAAAAAAASAQHTNKVQVPGCVCMMLLYDGSAARLDAAQAVYVEKP